MRRSFNKMFFAAIAMVAGIFGYRRSGGKGNTPAFTGTKSKMGAYVPLNQIVSMNGAAPIPMGRVLNQRQKRKYARQMGRKVA
jgi:hypothetical protein